jgi:FMN-dependent NADH-azoreductase
MSNSKPLNVLYVSSSLKAEDSVSRQLAAGLLAALEQRDGHVNIVHRDLAGGLPLIDKEWVAANYTPVDQRSGAQRDKLALSDQLVAELAAADVIVIGAPIYNFSIPATLKAWIDLTARAQLTFRYTESGPVGLLEDKETYVLAPSGGVPVGSPADFATPYLRHVLGFIGITDVAIIGAQGADRGNEEALNEARARIAELVHLGSRAA